MARPDTTARADARDVGCGGMSRAVANGAIRGEAVADIEGLGAAEDHREAEAAVARGAKLDPAVRQCPYRHEVLDGHLLWQTSTDDPNRRLRDLACPCTLAS